MTPRAPSKQHNIQHTLNFQALLSFIEKDKDYSILEIITTSMIRNDSPWACTICQLQITLKFPFNYWKML